MVSATGFGIELHWSFLKCNPEEETEGFCISFLLVNKNEYILTTVQLCVTNYLVMMNIQKLLNTIVEMI